MRPVVRRVLVGTIYGGLGAAAIVASVALTPQLPTSSTYWLVFLAFAVNVIVFSIVAAEVDERVFASSMVLVLMTAAGVLSSPTIDPSAATSAVFPVTVLAALGFYTRGDIGHRQFFRAIANFGQLAVAGFSAAFVFDELLDLASQVVLDGSIETVPMSSASRIVIAGAVAGVGAGATYAIVNLSAVQLGVRVLYGREARLPWSVSAIVVRSLFVQALLGSVLGLLLALSPSVALVTLTLTVFVIGHLVFASQATLRSTHENFLRGFVKILETRDLYTRGHTERVVEFALAIGDEVGLSSQRLARLRLAALIHDVGKLAVPTEIMRKQGALSDEEFQELRVATHRVDDLLSEVRFLDPLVTIHSGCHPRWDGRDFGQSGHVHTRVPTIEQSVLAVADAFDAMTSTRSYRMAMPQRQALERLSASADPLFDVAVVAALRRALERRGGTYGPPESLVTPDDRGVEVGDA